MPLWERLFITMNAEELRLTTELRLELLLPLNHNLHDRLQVRNAVSRFLEL